MQVWTPTLPGARYAEGKVLFSYTEQNTAAFLKNKLLYANY